jgi:cytochrome P450
LNPKEFKDPLKFKPERYMDEHVNDMLQGHWGFGAGTHLAPLYSVFGRI